MSKLTKELDPSFYISWSPFDIDTIFSSELASHFFWASCAVLIYLGMGKKKLLYFKA